MKLILLSILVMLTTSVYGQIKSASGYFPIHNKPNTAHYFKMSNGAHLDYFLNGKVKLGGKEYHAEIRNYSWGKVDTAYYREDDSAYYHYDLKTKSESVVLPKEIKIGQKWFEADKSWSYEVIGIEQDLKTPVKKYKNLIVVECIQLTNRDANKLKVYHQYYAEGLGLVGSVNNGKLFSFLEEVKTNAKEGDKIGSQKTHGLTAPLR